MREAAARRVADASEFGAASTSFHPAELNSFPWVPSSLTWSAHEGYVVADQPSSCWMASANRKEEPVEGLLQVVEVATRWLRSAERWISDDSLYLALLSSTHP